MAAGLTLLRTFAAIDSERIMAGSYARKELLDGYTTKEREFLEKQLKQIAEANERIRKLAWRLRNSA